MMSGVHANEKIWSQHNHNHDQLISTCNKEIFKGADSSFVNTLFVLINILDEFAEWVTKKFLHGGDLKSSGEERNFVSAVDML